MNIQLPFDNCNARYQIRENFVGRRAAGKKCKNGARDFDARADATAPPRRVDRRELRKPEPAGRQIEQPVQHRPIERLAKLPTAANRAANRNNSPQSSSFHL